MLQCFQTVFTLLELRLSLGAYLAELGGNVHVVLRLVTKVVPGCVQQWWNSEKHTPFSTTNPFLSSLSACHLLCQAASDPRVQKAALGAAKDHVASHWAGACMKSVHVCVRVSLLVKWF